MRKIGAAAATAAVLLSAACTQVSEGKQVQIPTFGGTPPDTAATRAETTSWTPTWEASIPTVAPAIKPTTSKAPVPKPTTTTKPPVVTTTTTTRPTFTIPQIPGVPFAQEGARCLQEGAVAITKSGSPLVCTRSGRGDALRWRKP
ncbi:hypothetical protein ALI144C_32550 [Actinosynnema sp. ALI-1.44]|uniref:hypothetical protein n=1 Tax=Actinosynnema sp. ALI-1.44 TaxID=1933779 RepID=UPI00097BE3FA|nr:hypothetical protein [Actinosynnema sp. ALI-1.44]ONI76870.1 hypothetical protein ALI144C_32550 [Actinosynnema sp. ALI-1.44]